jgi:hypothetical protein
MSHLRVLVDGRPLPADEARATWERFSAHMDANRGDFAGFASAEGFLEATVAVAGTTPTLSLSSTKAERVAEPAKGAARPPRHRRRR